MVNWHICLKCRSIQRTCCDNYPNIPLTIKDIRRISALGFSPDEFIIAGEYDADVLKHDECWWRNNAIKLNNRFFKVNTRKKKGRTCMFLDENSGCILKENRPALCKIYPFWVDSHNKVIYEAVNKRCLIVQSNQSISEGLAQMGETEKTIKKYFEEVKKDCLENRKEHKKLVIDAVKKGRVKLSD